MTGEQIWSDLMAGNERFRAGQPQPRDLVREREAVAQSQHPKAMVLACSDSRVAPEVIFDQSLGELFVVRVAANVADKLAIASLEFGADHLGVSLFVVIGHQRCGGVKAACSSAKAGSPNLKAIIKAVRVSGASAGLDGADENGLCDAEKQNTRYIAQSVLDRSDLLRDRVRRACSCHRLLPSRQRRNRKAVISSQFSNVAASCFRVFHRYSTERAKIAVVTNGAP